MGGRGSRSRLMGPAPGDSGTGGSDGAEELKDLEKQSYHYFYDKATGGWSYDGAGQDGHHQVEWFKANSNVDEVLNAVDASTKRAMRDWASGHFMDGQQYRGWDRMTMTDKEYTQRYDDMLDKSVLTKGVTVVRRTDAQLLMGAGVYTATLSQLQAMEGKEIISKGNMSTGAAAQGLTIGDDSKHHEFRIHIPAGSKGAGMWIGDKRVNPGWQAEQREFMTNRDIVMKVGKTSFDSARGVYITEMYYSHRMKHDYGSSGRLSL